MTPADKPMDRSEEVNIARWAFGQVAPYLTSDGLKILARAVLAMDEELRSIEKERQP